MPVDKSLQEEIDQETARIYREFLPYLESEVERSRGGGTLVLCLAAQEPAPDYHPFQQGQLSLVSEIISVLQADAQVDGIVVPYAYENIAFICRDKNRSDYAGKIDKAIEIIADHSFGRTMPQRKITMSFGLSSFPHDSEHAQQLFQQARISLKAAQEAGGNSMGCFWMLKSTPFPPIYP